MKLSLFVSAIFAPFVIYILCSSTAFISSSFLRLHEHRCRWNDNDSNRRRRFCNDVASSSSSSQQRSIDTRLSRRTGGSRQYLPLLAVRKDKADIYYSQVDTNDGVVLDVNSVSLPLNSTFLEFKKAVRKNDGDLKNMNIGKISVYAYNDEKRESRLDPGDIWNPTEHGGTTSKQPLFVVIGTFDFFPLLAHFVSELR